MPPNAGCRRIADVLREIAGLASKRPVHAVGHMHVAAVEHRREEISDQSDVADGTPYASRRPAVLLQRDQSPLARVGATYPRGVGTARTMPFRS